PATDGTAGGAFTPPSQVPETLSEELRALAISDEEAAEAGLTLSRGELASDKTPPDPYPVAARAHAAATAASASQTVIVPGGRRPPPAPIGEKAFQPIVPGPLPAEKACASCSALNPPAAKFCFDCGTPFPRKPAPAEAPP